MKTQKDQTEEAVELRKQAEAIARKKADQSPESIEALSPEEMRRSLHELQVYQIELEIQNEELRRTQAELEATRARYFDLYDLAPVGYCTVSEQGLILEANLTAANLLGVARVSLIKESLSQFILLEDQDIYYGHRKQLFVSGEPQACDLRMVKKDGTAFWGHLEATVAQDTAGAPICRIVISDISDRKCAEEAIKESEDRFRTIFEQAGVGVALVNTKTGQIIRINQKYCDFVGYTVQEMLQKTFMDITYYQDIQENADKNRQLIDGENREYTLEKRYLHKDGKLIWGNLTISPLWKSGEKPQTYFHIAVVEDISARKQAEEALHSAHWRLESIIKGTHVGTWAWNVQTGETIFNDIWAQIIGYTHDELAPISIKTWAMVCHPDDLKTSAELLARHFAGELPYYACECRMKHKDGHWVWVQDRGKVATWTADGKPLMMFGTHTDITERKQAEEALSANKAQLSTALEMAHLGHWEYDVATDLFTFNDQFYKIFRTTVGQVGGYRMHSAEYASRFVHPDDFDMVGEETRKAIEATDPHFNRQLEHRILYEDRTVGYITVRFFIVKDSHGQTIKTYGVNQDITERKQAEAQLRDSEAQFSSAFEYASIGKALVSPKGEWLKVNRATCDFLGYSQHELLDKTFQEITHPDDLETDLDYVKKMLAGTINTYQMEKRYIHKQGNTLWALLSVSLVRDQQGNPRYFISQIVDITDRKRLETERRQLEERLSRSEKMEALGTLAGGVAHDLNNVLGVAIAFSELLLDKIDETSPLRSYVKHIMDNSDRAAAIVDDLLTMARRGVQAEKVFNLNSTITDYQNSPEYQKLLTLHPHVQVKTHLDAELMNIQGSPVHLSKTIMNLVINSMEAMPKEGHLTITTGNQYLDRPVHGYDELKEGDYVVLSVSDTGEGISADEMKRIFEPFFTKKAMGKSGTGLGLSVVWGTVKDHNGYIDVQSEVGKGSTFTLYCPASREELLGKQAAVPLADYMGNGESILIVDDVAGQRAVALTLLGQLKYRVTAVSSGEEAVAYLQDHNVDLLVLDMIMDPGIDGLETYRRILEIRPQQKAILVSGFSESDRVRATHELGAGTYVKKPYIMEKLGLAVRKELDRSA